MPIDMTIVLEKRRVKIGFAQPKHRGYDAASCVGRETVRMTDDGLEAIFMINRSSLLRFLSLRSGGMDPDDLLQELWLKVRSFESGPIAEPRAYLFKMADNLVHDRRRADARRNRRDDDWSGSMKGA